MILELDALFSDAGAAEWGGVRYERLLPYMDEAARARAEALCAAPRWVLVGAWPYFAGNTPGNLSFYARGEDYHLVLGRKLAMICDFLQKQAPNSLFVPGADSSPLPEREAAWLAGVGLRGKNGLVIVPPYGSYVFLGTVLTGAELALEERFEAGECLNCGKCAAACPGGALGEVFCRERCLSHLTQKKGALDGAELALLRAHPLIWGCDACQMACPYNERALLTPIPEFSDDSMAVLEESMLEGLTNRSFREKYGAKAFAWRGLGVLKRNLGLKNE